MEKIIKKEIDYIGRKLSFETGVFAPLANMALLARYGDTVVLATVVSKKQDSKDPQDFFPLRVDYQEKLYAGGFIKSSRFVKREGRPSDEATITARLIDHAIRPLFPKDFMDEVQVIATALSVDNETDADVLSLIAASAALTASNIPWDGPMGTIRVGLDEKGENFIANPSSEQVEKSNVNMVISTLANDKVLAIEAGANIIPEEKILKAIEFANKENKPLIKLINDFAKEVGNSKYNYLSASLSKEILNEVESFRGKKIKEFVEKPLDKLDAVDIVEDIKQEIFNEFSTTHPKPILSRVFDELEKKYVRELVLEKNKRPDGRKIDEIRPIKIMLGLLPRTHGSAFFGRGLTQTLTIATLGSSSLEQTIQSMYGEDTKPYMHHYYGPPYSLGEVRQMMSPGRREIGHGALAEKALIPVIPTREKFPYAIRVVSEILSQNGSSSMAATCGSTLSLMDAGVPIKAPVAGIAMGLIANDNVSKYVLLTDMAGVEDFNGFMDFKMAGTREGVTAIQMDIKLKGIPLSMFSEILERSKTARIKILDLFDKAIQKPREQLSKYAPKVEQLKILQDQIGLVIGSGGKTIKEIMAKSKATVDISENEDGTAFVCIAGVDDESVKKAKEMVENILREVKVGDVYDGIIRRVAEFGAIVEVFSGKEGLLHVSEISHSFVDDPSKILKVGDTIKVKVINVERDGKVSLSKKALEAGGYDRNDRGDRGDRRRPPFRPENLRRGFRTPNSFNNRYKRPDRGPSPYSR